MLFDKDELLIMIGFVAGSINQGHFGLVYIPSSAACEMAMINLL